MLQWRKIESTFQNEWSDEAHISSLETLAHGFSTHKQLRDKSLRPSFEFDQILCCLNDISFRTMASIHAVQVIDRSFIFKALSHLWKLLRELNYLDKAWPDLDATIGQSGEGFAYQGHRPTLADGKKVLCSRYWYAFDIKSRNVPGIIKQLSRQSPGRTKISKIRPNWYFVTTKWPPLLHILIGREPRGLCSNTIGALHAGLIAYATVVAPLVD